jgi:quinol monooxygenase YgiN
MIVISGAMTIGTGSVDAFRALSRDLVEATLREAGCAAYTFAESISTPGRFEIFEEFTDEAALAEHTGADHYRQWSRALKDVEVLDVSIVRYDVSARTVLR